MCQGSPSYIHFENCLFSISNSVTLFRDRNMSQTWSWLALGPNPICHITFMPICVYPSVFVGRSVIKMFFTVVHPWRTDRNQTHSACVQTFANKCLFSPTQISWVHLLQTWLCCENINQEVFESGVGTTLWFVVQISGLLHYRLQRSLVMTLVSVPSVPVVCYCPIMLFHLWASVRI